MDIPSSPGSFSWSLGGSRRPSDYARRSAAELRAICAAHGFEPAGATRDAIVHEIDNELTNDGAYEMPLLLERGGAEQDGDFVPEDTNPFAS